MIEMMLGAMILALWVKVGAETAGDLVTTLRASKAGEWSLIDKQRDRKAAKSQSRREAMSKAWQATRSARNRKAGGTGQYRPGMAAYLGDVYHGVWEDQLEKRKAKRAARPQVGPDGKRPAPSRMDRAVEGKVDAQRAKTGYTGRIKQAGRLLIDPVGENRQSSGVMPPPASPPPAPAADGPRTACPVCGDSLTERDGSWSHPAESTCETARRSDGGHHVPQRVAEQATDLYRLNRAEGRSGALGETQTARDLRGMFGDTYPQHVYDQAAADATKTEPLNGTWMPNHDLMVQMALAALAEADPDQMRRARNMDDAHEAMYRKFPNIHPEAINEIVALADRAPGCNSCGQRRGAKPPCVHQQAAANRLRQARARANAAMSASKTSTTNDSSNTSNGGTTMSTGTVDLVDYNTAVAEHERALETLREQYAQAVAFEQHAAAVLAAVEAMDGIRGEVVNALAPLAEGMEVSRFGADSTQGSAEATSTLTAGTIAEVQEHVEAAADRNQQWKAELAASIEGVQGSLQHIKSQYGELAAGVQETGIDPNALAEH
ncbi:hypothetical protein [Micromonospora sp. NPDC005174]|uniref:hypothetical protein n=1 Tax=Micromonospora sp. NPDC005174 TaxID=3157018 RepID=UPI0033A69120